LRALRIAAPAQLTLSYGAERVDGRWEGLPEPTRAALLALLARLIAKGVLADGEEDGDG
jgi:hypothetical protein